MATVPKCKFDLEVCGGTFVDSGCVVDGNLVSGRTYHDHGQYMGHWIRLLIEAREEHCLSRPRPVDLRTRPETSNPRWRRSSVA